MIYISGSISYIYIKKNDIKLLILLDDHENTDYCNKGICINKFIEKLSHSSKYNIYVEEPLNYINTYLLWSSPHTKKLLNLYKTRKMNNIFRIDIRNIYESNFSDTIFLKNIIYNIYYLFSYLFKKKLQFDINIKPNKKLKELKQKFKKLICKNKNNKKIKTHITKICLCIKYLYEYTNKINISINKYNKLYKNQDYDLIGFPYNKLKLNKLNCIIYYEFLVNCIMEFYFILLLFESKKTNILYAGVFHCINIIYILVYIYNFKIIKKSENLDINFNNNKLETIIKKFNKNCIKL